VTPSHEWCKVDSLVGWLVSSGGGFGHPVRLPLPLHRVRIECVGIARSKRRSRRDQYVVETAARIATGTHLNARSVDTFLLRKVLFDVEVALSCGIRCLIGRMLADDNQLGRRLSVKS